MTLLISSLTIFLLQAVNSFPCQWTPAREVGNLRGAIDEASGLAVSRKYPDRLYHVNDSGDAGRFFITDYSGRNSQPVNISEFVPRDVEDMAIGPCTPSFDCLFVGDIGDNNGRRRFIDVLVIGELQNFGVRVQPLYRVQIQYPDRPYDAESFAVHPDGTMFFLTKGGTPRLYRLKKDQWMNGKLRTKTLEFVTAIDFEKLGGPAAAIDGPLSTRMSISPDGKRVLVLTYRNVFELLIDLAQPVPAPGAPAPAPRGRRR